IRWPDGESLLDDEALTAWMVARLRADLASVESGPIVVVTHHLPFLGLVLVRGRLPWDYLNGFMGSQALGEVILQKPGALHVISGHTHARRRALLRNEAGERVVASVSPIGYPREYRTSLATRVLHRISLLVI